MKQKVFMIASLVLTILTLVAIWQFSAQSATDSSALSGGIVEFLVGLPLVGDVLKINGLEAVIRKLAHGTIYALLGVSFSGMIITVYPKRQTIIWTLAFGMVYAIIDEFHQGFIPGRAPRVFDVVIDTIGVCIGALIGVWFYRKFIAKKNPGQK